MFKKNEEDIFPTENTGFWLRLHMRTQEWLDRQKTFTFESYMQEKMRIYVHIGSFRISFRALAYMALFIAVMVAFVVNSPDVLPTTTI